MILLVETNHPTNKYVTTISQKIKTNRKMLWSYDGRPVISFQDLGEMENSDFLEVQISVFSLGIPLTLCLARVQCRLSLKT